MLIGLIGEKGAGKDTLADALRHSGGVVRVAFADALKDEVAAAFAVGLAYLENRDTKETPAPDLALSHCNAPGFVDFLDGEDPYADRSPRWIMQRWGDWRRERYASDYWLRVAARSIAELTRSGTDVIVTDVRFMNEVDALRAAGAWVVRIVRPHNPFGGNDAHASENELAHYPADLTVYNNGSEHDLADTASRMLSHLKQAPAKLAA
jgi:hypothetical protein